ncbi:MAG: hypothetical protein ABI550_00665, partial [Ignavibacteriaceae bacterium]
NNYTLKYLSELMGKDIKSGEVESNLLLEEKYSKFCEVSVSSKDEWDKLMNSKEGKALNKDMADFHQSVTAIFVNYEGNK